MQIDIHIHSNFSDGTYSVEEIVKKAKEKDLSLIALTDHNTLDGNSLFSQISKKYNQPALAGIEISTVYKNEEIHLLGYFPINSNFFYPQYDELVRINKNYKDSKKIQLEKMIEKLSKDYDVSIPEFYEYINSIKDNTNYNRVHLANYMIHKGIVSSVKEAFDGYISEESKYYVKKEQTNLLDAISAVINAGGIVSIAHLSQYNLSYNEKKEMLLDIGNITKEFGVELFHYDHTKENIDEYIRMCKEIKNKKGLKIFYTAGADCHGKNKPNEIGCPYNFDIDKKYKLLYEDISKKFIELINEKYKIIDNIEKSK